MCYEFETYYAKARIAEQLRKKAEERKRRSDSPTPADSVDARKPVKPEEPVPA